MSEFFLFCFSHGKSSRTDNTPSDFEVEFPRRFDLFGDWRIALLEIAYPVTFFNLTKDNVVIFRKVDLGEGRTDQTNAELHRGVVKAGRYGSAKAIVERINEIMTVYRKEKSQPVIRDSNGIFFEEFTNKINISFEKDLVVEFDKELDDLLGNPNSAEPKFIDISNSEPGLFLYCDLVAPSIVGGTYANILRVIEPPSSETKFGDQIFIPYDSRYYLPLSSKEFHKARFLIKDDHDRIMDMKSGETFLLLHLKKFN